METINTARVIHIDGNPFNKAGKTALFFYISSKYTTAGQA